MRRLALIAGLIALSTSCFLPDKEEFQGAWDASLSTGQGVTGQGTTVSLHFDFSLIVEDRFTADALLSVTEPLSVGPGLPIGGRAFGKVEKREIRVVIPIQLLDGSTQDLILSADRDLREDDFWPVRIEWDGSATETSLQRPIGNRWDLDTADPG